jgi:hypothetical protein
MSDPRLKQLKIKTGVLKRVGKEKLSYRNVSSFSLSFYAYICLLDYNIFVAFHWKCTMNRNPDSGCPKTYGSGSTTLF